MSIVHEEAERCRGRAPGRAELGNPDGAEATRPSTTMEDVAVELGDSPRWFPAPTGPPTKRQWPPAFVARAAQERGATAPIVVTPRHSHPLAWRPRADPSLSRAPYLPFPQGGRGVGQLFSTTPVLPATGLDKSRRRRRTRRRRWALWATLCFSNPGLKTGRTWRSSRPHTDLPIVLKGACWHPDDDARRAVLTQVSTG